MLVSTPLSVYRVDRWVLGPVALCGSRGKRIRREHLRLGSVSPHTQLRTFWNTSRRCSVPCVTLPGTYPRDRFTRFQNVTSHRAGMISELSGPSQKWASFEAAKNACVSVIHYPSIHATPPCSVSRVKHLVVGNKCDSLLLRLHLSHILCIETLVYGNHK